MYKWKKGLVVAAMGLCVAIFAWYGMQGGYSAYTVCDNTGTVASLDSVPMATQGQQLVAPAAAVADTGLKDVDFILWDFALGQPGYAPYFMPSISSAPMHAGQATSITSLGNEGHSNNSVTYIGGYALRWCVQFPFDASSGIGMASGRIPQNQQGLNPTSIGMWVRLDGVTFANSWGTVSLQRMFLGVSTTPVATTATWHGFTPTVQTTAGWANVAPPPTTHQDWFWLEFPLNPTRWLSAAQIPQSGQAFSPSDPLYFPFMANAPSNAAATFLGMRHSAGVPHSSGSIYISGLTFFYNYNQDDNAPNYIFSGPGSVVQGIAPIVSSSLVGGNVPMLVRDNSAGSAPLVITALPGTHPIDFARSRISLNGQPIEVDTSGVTEIELYGLADEYDYIILAEFWDTMGFRAGVYTLNFRIDTNPTMATSELLQEFLAAIDFAQNRLRNATPVGSRIYAGRHNQEDMDYFALKIEDAVRFLEMPDVHTYEFVTNTLHEILNATGIFMEQIIEPTIAAGSLGGAAPRYGQRDEASNPVWYYIARGEDILQRDYLRGAWLTTAWNIDFPSAEARGTTPAHVDRQRAELRTSFEELHAIGINAVIFQVSPHGCVFFRSDMAPWSFFLTGVVGYMGELVDSQGRAWDPLEYAIQLAREFNMEFHAWFNPYRVGSTATTIPLYGGNVRSIMTTPEAIERWPRNPWFMFGDEVRAADTVYYVNPGLPEVRNWVVERILEVVINYDIDVLHFDDYFYWAGTDTFDTFQQRNTLSHNTFSNQVFPNTREGYNDWRRENTSLMVQDVSNAIRTYAPWVRFGISPAGVFSRGDGRTGAYGEAVGAPGVGIGSTGGGYFNYQNSFADTRTWVVRNLIDYITPQLYWCVNHAISPFGAIADWWARLIRDYSYGGQHVDSSPWGHTYTQLFAGLAPYRVDRDDWGNNRPESEFEGMRNYIRLENYSLGHPHISGSMMFTTRDIIGDGIATGTMYNMRNQTDMAGSGMWRYTALVPPAHGLGAVAPRNPVDVTVYGNTISWQDGELSTLQLIRARYFVVYGAADYPVDILNPANILAVVQAKDEPGQSYSIVIDGSVPAYVVVTAANRLHHQSQPGFEPVEGMSTVGSITANGVQLGGSIATLVGPTVNFTSLVTGYQVRGVYASLTIGTTVIDVSDRIMRRGSDPCRTQVPLSLTYTFEPQHFGQVITIAMYTSSGATAVQFILEEPAPPVIISPAANSRVYVPGFELPFLFTAQVYANQPVDWIVSGMLPHGVSVLQRGRFYLDFFGTPSQVGEFQISMVATNAQGAYDTHAFTLIVEPPAPPQFVNAAVLPSGALEVAYNFIIEVDSAYALDWDVYRPGLPPGLTFVDGAIRGVPTKDGNFGFDVTVTNPYGGYATQHFTIIIETEPMPRTETRAHVMFDFENANVAVPLVPTQWVVAGNEVSTTQLVRRGAAPVYAGNGALQWHITEVGNTGPALSARTQTQVPRQLGQNPTGLGFWILFDNMAGGTGAGAFWHDMPLRVGLLNGSTYMFWTPAIDRSPGMANQWQWVEICFVTDIARIPLGNAVVDFDPQLPLFVPGAGNTNANAFIFFRQVSAANMNLNIYIDNVTFLYGGITGEQANFAPPTINYTIQEVDGVYGVQLQVRDMHAGLDRARLQVFAGDTNNLANNATWVSPRHVTANMFIPKSSLPAGDILTIEVVAWNNAGRVSSQYIHVDMRYPTVVEVNVSPSTATVRQAAQLQLSYTMESINDPPQYVAWTVSGHSNAQICELGVLSVGREVPIGTVLTVRATSTFDSAVYGTATITVAEIMQLTSGTHYITWGFGAGQSPQFSNSVTGAGSATTVVEHAVMPADNSFTGLFDGNALRWGLNFPLDGTSGIGNAEGRVPQNADGLNPTAIGMWLKLDGVYLTDLVRMTVGVSTAQTATEMTFRGFTPTLGSTGAAGVPGMGDPGLLAPQDGWVFVEFPLYTGVWLNNMQLGSRGIPFSPTQELWLPSGTSTGNNIVGSFISMRHQVGSASGQGSIYVGGIVFFYNYDGSGEPQWESFANILFPDLD